MLQDSFLPHNIDLYVFVTFTFLVPPNPIIFLGNFAIEYSLVSETCK